MRGYVISHKSYLYDGIRADYYRNDPYVWHTPYLWSFCHLNQNPAVEEGMTVLWLSRDDAGTFVCDLVFVVREILPFTVARDRYAPKDPELAHRHFAQGASFHPEVQRPQAKTYVADMDLSYIPHPSVPLEHAVDRARLQQWTGSKPLAIAWRRPSTPLRIEGMDDLSSLVDRQAITLLRGPLGSGGHSPGEAEPLRP
jgi:hypothetical protein